jgi:hypothetical protein
MRPIVVGIIGLSAAVFLSLALAGCPMQPTFAPTITPIYAATDAGLEVYDGTKWTNYTTANGLASSNITSVVVSGSGSGATVFAGTAANGISISNGSTWSTWTISSGLGSDTINGLFLGSSLYAATPGGLSVYNFDGTWTTGVIPANDVFVLGSFTYAAGTQLSIYNGTALETSFSANAIVPTGTKVNAVIVDPYGDIFAATDKGLNVLPGGSSSFLPTPLLSGMAVNRIFLDNNGDLYAASANGLYKIATAGATSILTGAVYCVYVDGAGTIYVGTASGLEISKDGGSTWSKSPWTAKVNTVVTTAPLYSF